MARGLDCGCAQGMLPFTLPCTSVCTHTLAHTRIHRTFNKLSIPIHTNMCHFIVHKEHITDYVFARRHAWAHSTESSSSGHLSKWNEMGCNKWHCTISPQSLKIKENNSEFMAREKNICRFHEHSHSITGRRNLKISAESAKMSCNEKAFRRNKTALRRSLWRNLADTRGWQEGDG